MMVYYANVCNDCAGSRGFACSGYLMSLPKKREQELETKAFHQLFPCFPRSVNWVDTAVHTACVHVHKACKKPIPFGGDAERYVGNLARLDSNWAWHGFHISAAESRTTDEAQKRNLPHVPPRALPPVIRSCGRQSPEWVVTRHWSD